VTIALTGFVGRLSQLAFLAFLVFGSLSPIDLGLGSRGLLWLDAGLSLAFFIQHSLMVRKSFRGWSNRLIPDYYNGVLYTIASGIMLLSVVCLWQESDVMIISVHGVARWLLRAVPLLAIAGFAWGGRSLRFFDPFGVRPILDRISGREPRSVTLVAAGPYRWVRHPLYLFMVLIFWSYPDLTADRLLFNTLWTAWTVVGALLEERDLVAEFGDSYRKYQRTVPMLIPYRIPQKERVQTAG
jgi:protein-S-isoprenylcysteine O-methyltransferase Ste14